MRKRRSWRTTLAGFFALGCGCAGLSSPPQLPTAIPALVAENAAAGDPYEGRFPYEEAVSGLPEGDRLHAVLETDSGAIHCRLERGAPLTVANFVGLARGIRPFRDANGSWVREPYYDGSTWHRALENQFVQTGQHGELDGPGFRIQDEMSPGHVFDRSGLLAMANKGAEHSASAQFFVTTSPLPDLNGQYTIFGSCDDEHVVREIERRVVAGEAPVLQQIVISRS